MAAALLGLVMVQAWMLGQTVRLKDRVFCSTVQSALTRIVENLEARRTLERIVRVSVDLKTDGKGYGPMGYGTPPEPNPVPVPERFAGPDRVRRKSAFSAGPSSWFAAVLPDPDRGSWFPRGFRDCRFRQDTAGGK